MVTFTFIRQIETLQLWPSDNYLILRDYVYWNERFRIVVKIKKGFITDGCSMPIFLRGLVRATYNRTDIIWPVHDALYRNNFNKQKADIILDDMLSIEEMGVSWLARLKVYYGLKWFGSPTTDQQLIDNAIRHTEIHDFSDFGDPLESLAYEVLNM
jgi:hypothetical protein